MSPSKTWHISIISISASWASDSSWPKLAPESVVSSASSASSSGGSRRAPGEVAVPDSTDFGSVGAELDWVMGRLTAADIEHILVADLSPREEYGVKGARVMVPGTELWFCPDYVPSQFLAARAVRTVEAAREMF